MAPVDTKEQLAMYDTGGRLSGFGCRAWDSRSCSAAMLVDLLARFFFGAFRRPGAVVRPIRLVAGRWHSCC